MLFPPRRGVRGAQSRNLSSPAATAALFCAAAVLASSIALAQDGPTRDWTKTHFSAAFDDFFPLRQAQGDFIAIRAHQNDSNEAPEFSFIIENTQDPKAISATLREAQGTSLYQQLAALHAKDPSKSYEDLKPELKVQTWNFTPGHCPAVKEQYDAFENIQFIRPRDEDEPGENPIVYEINETVAGGSSQVIEFMPNRAIPLWAEGTRKALLACAVPLRDGGSGSKSTVGIRKQSVSGNDPKVW